VWMRTIDCINGIVSFLNGNLVTGISLTRRSTDDVQHSVSIGGVDGGWAER
jgi:hypothetical protein